MPFVYVPGTGAEDASGPLAVQLQQIMERNRAALAGAGTSLDRVVSVTVYLKSAADFQAMNEAYRAYWPADPPTRTTVIADLARPGALVEVSMVAAAAGAERVVVHPGGWSRSPSPYSYAIKSDDTLFLSGIVPRSATDNSAIGGDIKAQTRAVLDNAGAILTAAGLSFAHVVSNRVYITRAANFQAMNDVYRDYFPSAPPARATVEAGLAGAGYLVEMTMTASSAPREAVGQAPPGIPISAAVRAGGNLHLSGVLGNTPQTSGDVAAQTRETLTRILKTLSAAGASPADVVDSLVYLRDMSHLDAMDAEYRAFFGTRRHARTVVGTGLVPDDGLVEIMVTAVSRR
jgi:2-iminobutanoate/2-iminopropanoate deaminase